MNRTTTIKQFREKYGADALYLEEDFTLLVDENLNALKIDPEMQQREYFSFSNQEYFTNSWTTFPRLVSMTKCILWLLRSRNITRIQSADGRTSLTTCPSMPTITKHVPTNSAELSGNRP